MVDLGKLKIGVQVDGENAKKQLNDIKGTSAKTAQGMQTDWTKVASTLSNTGKTLTKNLTLPIVALAGVAVKLASDMEETTNKIDVVFADNAQTVKNWASDSIESMGLARQTALDMASTFGDMGTGMGLTNAEAMNMSTSLVQLSADLASFKNISIDRANTALTGVYTGETEALKGLGIVMTEANLLAFAEAEGIEKSYKEMSQAEKVALRYKYVISISNTAQGDFVRTGGGMANQSRMIKENLKELGVQFGEALLPTVNKVVTSINELLKKFQLLSPEQKETIVTIGLLVAALGPVIMIVGKFISAYNTLKTAVVTANASMNASMGVIGLIVIAITAFIAIISKLKQQQEEYAKAAEERFDKAMQESAEKVNGLKDAEEKAEEKTVSLREKLEELAKTDPEVKAKVDTASAVINTDELRDALGKLITKTGDLKENIEAVNEALRNHGDALKAARYSQMIDDIFTIIPLMKEQGATTEEIANYVDEAVGNFNDYAAAVDESAATTGDFTAAMADGKITADEMIPIIDGLSTTAEGLYGDISSVGEGMAILDVAMQNGTISEAGYNAVAQETAALLAEDMMTAVTDISDAYDTFSAAEQNAYDVEAQQRADAQNIVDGFTLKLEALHKYSENIQNGMTSVEALRVVEEGYGTETAQALKDAFIEKIGTTDAGWNDVLNLTNEWTADVQNAEEGLNLETGSIAQRRKDSILAAENQLQTELSTVTTGWTDEQIEDFANLAEAAGFELDEGFLDMLTSTNKFVEDSQGAWDKNGDYIPGTIEGALSNVLLVISNNRADIVSETQSIGEGVADGIAVGIKMHQYKAVNAATKAVQAAIAAAKKAGDIQSPSRKMRDMIGKPLAEGIGVGFEDNIQKVIKKVQLGIGNITSGGATVAKRATTNNVSNTNNKITQNINFTDRVLTPYEQQLKARRLSKELAGAFR